VPGIRDIAVNNKNKTSCPHGASNGKMHQKKKNDKSPIINNIGVLWTRWLLTLLIDLLPSTC
jgi:hypothetical protein